MKYPLMPLARPHEGDDQARIMAQALSGLFFAGASLALLSTALPHAGHSHRGPFFAVVASAYSVSLVLFWNAKRAPRWLTQLLLAGGTLHVTAVAYFSGERPSPLILFYLWVFLHSSYFLSRKQATVQIAVVGACFATLLIALPPPGGVLQWWLIAMGTMIVAALLTGAMSERASSLVTRLHEVAHTDSLTGLANHRHYCEVLDHEVARSQRTQTHFSIIAGDLDRFKEVNDRLGHPAGDAVLQRVAHLLSRGARQSDTAARVGGEEFGLVLPETEPTGAMLLAERLRDALEAEFADDPVPISISLGIAAYPTHGITRDAILAAADHAMYQAKAAGGNRAVISTEAGAVALA
jgi:diguanylate cyclase (GGDEF)-like protein